MLLHVHCWGEGPEVVLLHGAGHGAREAWHAQRELTERWTLLAVDRIGHGRSPDGRQDAEADGRLVAEQLLDRRRHLVGFSLGGVAALVAAGLRPEHVRSLVVVEPPAVSVAPEHPAVRRWGAPLQEAVRAAYDTPAARLRAFLELVGADAEVPDALPPSMERAARALEGMRLPGAVELPLDVLDAAGVPVLVVTGGHDEAYEVIGDRIAGAVDAERAIVPGRRHLVAETGPPFNALVEAFWASVG